MRRSIVDGKPSGAANQTLRLVATTHEIEIRKAGFVDFKTSVTPRPGVPQVDRDDAADGRADAHSQRHRAVIRTKVDQQLKLMPIGRFTMGSPRREPGRRANEAQRDVEFKRAFYMGVTRSHERRSSGASSPSTAPASSARTRSISTISRSSASPGRRRRVLQLVVGAGRAAACLREEGRHARAGQSDDERAIACRPMPSGNGSRATKAAASSAAIRGAMRCRSRRAQATTRDTHRASDVCRSHSGLRRRLMPRPRPSANSRRTRSGCYDMGGNVAEWVHDYYTVSVDASAGRGRSARARPRASSTSSAARAGGNRA